MSALTGPSRPIGEVQAEVVIGTGRRTEQSAQEALDELEDAVDRDLKDTADVWGDTLADGMSDRLAKKAPDIADEFDSAMARQRVTGFTFRVDKDGTVIQRWVKTELVDPVADFIDKEGKKGPNGMFGRISQGISDAIGSGFNISGRSPLIGVLVFVLGYIAELIVGAIQAVGGLISLLYIVPGLLLSIGIQASLLVIAFQGFGSAVKAAFAAENAYELEQAIKDLTPAAQEFVKELVPIKKELKGFRDIIQEAFFTGVNQFSGPDSLFGFLARIDVNRLKTVATELGKTVTSIFTDFDHPRTTEMFNVLMQSTTMWLNGLRAAFAQLIPGFRELVIAAAPFMDWFGTEVNEALQEFGNWLYNISKGGSLGTFLEESKETLSEIWALLGAIIKFFYVLWNQLNEAGGDSVIREITEQLERFTEFLQSPTGQQALEGFITLVVLLARAFIGLLIVVMLILAGFQTLVEFLESIFGPVFDTTTRKVKETGAAVDQFFGSIGPNIQAAITMIEQTWTLGLARVRDTAFTVFASVASFVGSRVDYVAAVISNLPAVIVNSVSNLGYQLYIAGANAVQGLINGLLSKLGPLGGAMSVIAQAVYRFLPHSPAEEGPLSGSGDPLKSGQTIVERLAMGMEMESPRLSDASSSTMSNINFGSGAFQMNFYGPPPNQQQAVGIGTGLGNGISGILAQRDARLTVRAMA